MSIPVWASVPPTTSLCEVKHGAELELLEAMFKPDENRYYYSVRAGKCVGWLPQTFVAANSYPGIGKGFE